MSSSIKPEPDGYNLLDEDVDLSNITPMPKHVLLNTLPGHLAPFPTIPRSRYETDRSQREFYGQESFLNSFITAHSRDPSAPPVATAAPTGFQSPHQPMLKRNQCELCLRMFANSASLKQHKRLHRGERPYKCRFCDKTSATMCNILTHERTHTRERPYKCDVCDADFSSSSNLKTHMRTHSGDRPFRCNLCDRRFVTSNALTTHLRVHWGLRLHPCPLCERQFSTSSNLRVHHRTVHLGIKLFRCPVCDKAFATSSNLNAHSRHHPESAYLVKYNGNNNTTTTDGGSEDTSSSSSSSTTTRLNASQRKQQQQQQQHHLIDTSALAASQLESDVAVSVPVLAGVPLATPLTNFSVGGCLPQGGFVVAGGGGGGGVGVGMVPSDLAYAPHLVAYSPTLPVILGPSATTAAASKKCAKVSVYQDDGEGGGAAVKTE